MNGTDDCTNLALSACHVVASLVLLDARLAFRALLRVRQDPVRRLAFILALLLPHLKLRAGRWIVRLLSTSAKHAQRSHAILPELVIRITRALATCITRLHELYGSRPAPLPRFIG